MLVSLGDVALTDLVVSKLELSVDGVLQFGDVHH